MPRRGIDLTEDQWRLVKSHAAKRGQTISEFFAEVLGGLGMDGRVPPAMTTTKDPEFARFRPVPKPGKK